MFTSMKRRLNDPVYGGYINSKILTKLKIEDNKVSTQKKISNLLNFHTTMMIWWFDD